MNIVSPLFQVVSVVGVVLGFEFYLYLRRTCLIHCHKMGHRKNKHRSEKNNKVMQADKKRD